MQEQLHTPDRPRDCYALGESAVLPPLHRILCLRPDGVGDMVCLLPALESLRAAYPHAQIAVLASPRNAALLAHSPAVDRVYRINLKGEDGTPWRLWRWGRLLRREQYDAVFAFRTETRTHYLAAATRAPYRVGYADKPLGRWLTHVRTQGHRRGAFHEIDRNLWLLELLNIPAATRQPRLVPTEAERAAAQQWLAKHGLDQGAPLLGVHPGASTPDRCYPEPRYAEVVQRLLERWFPGGHVLVFGGPSDRNRVAALTNALTARSVPYHHPKTRDLRELMALMERCRLIFVNDSGPMHVAAALGVPFVAVFGPGDHVRWMPPGEHGRLVRPKDPRATDLRTIPPERLFAAAEELLSWALRRNGSSF